MSIYEYNEEYVRKSLFEDGVQTGYNKGYDSGNAQRLVQSIDAVMTNLNVDLAKSCEILGITVEEYEKAKQNILTN